MVRYLLFTILIVAAVLRLYGLDRGDTVNDEVFYGFRAIGLLDFDKAETQKTPLEWWDSKATGGASEIPWWTKLSFHDHPPLVFWIQHIFMRLLGDETWAMRLPSAVLGVASVYLIYCLGRLLVSEGAGFFGAALAAVTLNNVYITRTGMQESYVIFFMLLASYLFVRAVTYNHYFIWTGVVLGLAFLTKYTSFILVPIFLTYLLLFRRDLLLDRKLWLGAFLSLLIFSPVLVYNIQLWRATGHFDFQISRVIGQVPEGWREAPGKEIGTLGDRLKNFIPRLVASNSWLFLGLFVISLFFLRNSFLFLVFGFLFLLLLLIGPSYRFLTMLTPWTALSIGMSFQAGERCLRAGLMRRAGTVPRSGGGSEAQSPRAPNAGRSEESDKAMLTGLLAVAILVIMAFEIFYTYNNQIAYYPKGPEPWLASKVRYENYNWGYNALDDYLKREFMGRMPALTFETRYRFLEDTQNRALAKAEARGFESYPALVTYYGNFDEGARLWVFDRRHVYHAWPIITLDTYFQYLRENGADYYARVGFKNYYFIEQTNIAPSYEFKNLVSGVEPIFIKNPRGDIVFKIYKFSR